VGCQATSPAGAGFSEKQGPWRIRTEDSMPTRRLRISAVNGKGNELWVGSTRVILERYPDENKSTLRRSRRGSCRPGIYQRAFRSNGALRLSRRGTIWARCVLSNQRRLIRNRHARLTPLHSTPLHSTPLHSTPLHSTPLHSTPLHSTLVGRVTRDNQGPR